MKFTPMKEIGCGALQLASSGYYNSDQSKTGLSPVASNRVVFVTYSTNLCGFDILVLFTMNNIN